MFVGVPEISCQESVEIANIFLRSGVVSGCVNRVRLSITSAVSRFWGGSMSWLYVSWCGAVHGF